MFFNVYNLFNFFVAIFNVGARSILNVIKWNI